MLLGELITQLAAADQTLVLPYGFHKPHSYRGYYTDLAFEPTTGITVADMLTAARSALGTTYQGYKGGDFQMGEHSDCWLAEYGHEGEGIGPVLIGLMLAAGRTPALLRHHRHHLRPPATPPPLPPRRHHPPPLHPRTAGLTGHPPPAGPAHPSAGPAPHPHTATTRNHHRSANRTS